MLSVDVPGESAGKVIEQVTMRKGELLVMNLRAITSILNQYSFTGHCGVKK